MHALVGVAMHGRMGHALMQHTLNAHATLHDELGGFMKGNVRHVMVMIAVVTAKHVSHAC